MKNQQHTSGPWFQCDTPWDGQVCSKPEYDKAIASGMDDETACGESLICETADNIANARLIAAAPDLLDLLQQCQSALDTLAEDALEAGYGARAEAATELALQARTAIQKATQQ